MNLWPHGMPCRVDRLRTPTLSTRFGATCFVEHISVFGRASAYTPDTLTRVLRGSRPVVRRQSGTHVLSGARRHNQKMRRAIAIGGCVAGAGLLATSVAMASKSKRCDAAPSAARIPEYVLPLVDLVGEDAVAVIAMDPTWTELCDRAADYAALARDELKELLLAVARVVAFQVSLQVNRAPLTLGTPRVFRSRLHAVVEAVRVMRAAVEDKCASALDEFDEVAADIQRTHDDYAYNMLLDAQSRAP